MSRKYPGKKWKRALKLGDKTIQRGKPDDIIILVMGATGVGKSTFINHYFGDSRANISDTLTSCTPEVKDYIHTLPSKRRIVLVDTPGFNDSHHDEAEILRRVSVWLASAYDAGTKITGIVYMSDITQKRMYGTARMNLNMFQRVCGTNYFDKVVMATSHWDAFNGHSEAESREQELKDTFWKPLLDHGATTRRITKPEDVRELVNFIVGRHIQNENNSISSSDDLDVMALQRELVDLDKSIPMTQAGRQLKKSLKDLLDALKQGVADETDPAKKEQLREMIMSLQGQLQMLDVPFGERLRNWFSRTFSDEP